MPDTAAPADGSVQCLSPSGLHAMRYVQWGDPRNARVLVCVHGLTRTGRDFDTLARSLSDRFRVVCPDVVGRGRSDWLRDPSHYAIPQYLSDMVTLLARLDAEEISWLGTSMGGLVGICLAGLENSPVRRLVLNDVGPRMEAPALARIAAYVGQSMRFASFDEGVAYVRSISAGFGMRSDAEWRQVATTVLKPDGAGFALHYDPAIAVPVRALGAEGALAGEKLLWSFYDRIACPTLVLHGAESDLLSAVGVQEMVGRGPRPRVVTFPGIGHAPMFFDPAQIAPVREFLLGN